MNFAWKIKKAAGGRLACGRLHVAGGMIQVAGGRCQVALVSQAVELPLPLRLYA